MIRITRYESVRAVFFTVVSRYYRKFTCMMGYVVLLWLFLTRSNQLLAGELNVGKVCPVTKGEQVLGHLVLSTPWYHDGDGNAAYIARDNAIGVGIEIHFFSNKSGDVRHLNVAQCHQFRLLQVRFTNSKLLPRQTKFAIDVPSNRCLSN